ncbi:MAG TPA: hypothetical protein VGP33_10765 [Chloroflexota bacterium]|jgi:hypothetical protein|nr:hypothetical protein [Chloroflexota bacterium]
MLPTRHAALGAVAALALAPWLRRQSAALWAGSVFIDVDHYAWYVLHCRDLSLSRAYRYFAQIRTGERRLEGDARPLHGPLNIAWMALLAWRWPAFRPVFLGVLVHSLLDAYAERRLNALLPLVVRAA